MPMTAKLSPKLEVSGQIQPADVPELARKGFTAIVNNRPDGEEPGQPSAEEVRTAAEAEGLAYVYLPMVPAELSPELVSDLAAAIERSPGPVLAHCRSGMRSVLLWALAQASEGTQPVDQILTQAAGAGFDISRMRPMIEHFAAR
jgi:sulfide:quinone oxidoreductase